MQALVDAARIAKFFTEAKVRATHAQRTKTNAKFGAWLRSALAAQGPTFVKAGQFLSSRNDVLPRNVALELRSLQDNVNPMDFEQVQLLVNAETGAPSLWDVFETFDEEPIASASIGQVHRARLRADKQDVAVKIQKPNVLDGLRRDIAAVRSIVNVSAALGMRGSSDAHHVLNDLEAQMEQECDFLSEAASMRRFKEASKHFHWLHIPRIVDRHSTKRMLVMEFIPYDFKTTDIPESYSRRHLTAHRMVELMMWMVLDAGILHCDMHPGNVCLKERGGVVLYDFGTVLDITPQHRRVMQELATHMYNDDPKKTVKLMLQAGMITMKEGHSPSEAEKFFAAVIKSTRSDFSATDMHAAMGEPPFIAAMSVFRLFRAMMMVEAACKSLDPGFSYFKYMRPFLGAQLAMMAMVGPLE